MSDQPTLDDVPQVLPEDEEPFVIRVGVDGREALDVHGIRVRRSRERCVLDVPYGGERMGLRASMVADASGTFVYANAGAFPAEVWSLLAQGGAEGLPVLSAGVTGQPVMMSDGREMVEVRVLPGNERVPVTTTLLAFGPDLAGANPLELGRIAAAPVIGTALHALVEYRTAMGDVPDVAVPTSDGTMPLASLLELAGRMGDAVGWTPRTV